MAEVRPRLRPHQFVPGRDDGHGNRTCETCDGLEHYSVHRVREVTDDERAVEARRVGESPP